jgi:hypothetical protein
VTDYHNILRFRQLLNYSYGSSVELPAVHVMDNEIVLSAAVPGISEGLNFCQCTELKLD